MRRCASHSDPLGVIEEEKLVLLDRTANRKTELVASKPSFFYALSCIVVSISSEGSHPVKFVRATVEVVGAGLSRYVNHSTCSAAILSRHAVADDTELLHCVKRNGLADRGSKQIHILGTIKQDAGAGGTLTIERIPSPSCITHSGLRVLRRIGGGCNQVVGISGESWQLSDLNRVHNGRYLLVKGIDRCPHFTHYFDRRARAA